MVLSKIIDLSKTVYEICTEDPKVVDIMRELGGCCNAKDQFGKTKRGI